MLFKEGVDSHDYEKIREEPLDVAAESLVPDSPISPTNSVDESIVSHLNMDSIRVLSIPGKLRSLISSALIVGVLASACSRITPPRIDIRNLPPEIGLIDPILESSDGLIKEETEESIEPLVSETSSALIPTETSAPPVINPGSETPVYKEAITYDVLVPHSIMRDQIFNYYEGRYFSVGDILSGNPGDYLALDFSVAGEVGIKEIRDLSNISWGIYIKKIYSNKGLRDGSGVFDVLAYLRVNLKEEFKVNWGNLTVGTSVFARQYEESWSNLSELLPLNDPRFVCTDVPDSFPNDGIQDGGIICEYIGD